MFLKAMLITTLLVSSGIAEARRGSSLRKDASEMLSAQEGGVQRDENGRRFIEFGDNLLIYIEEEETGWKMTGYSARSPLVIPLAQEYLRVCLIPNKSVADVTGADAFAACQLMALLSGKMIFSGVYQCVRQIPVMLDVILAHAINFTFWSGGHAYDIIASTPNAFNTLFYPQEPLLLNDKKE